jgi:hypothetical protein
VLVLLLRTSLADRVGAIKTKSYVGQAVLVLETGVGECWSVGVMKFLFP